MAGETAPLTLRTQEEAQQESRKDAGRLPYFGSCRSYLGVTSSNEWLYQARVGGLMLGLRVFTPDGAGLTFQEDLSAASTGRPDIRLGLSTYSREGGLLLQMDQHALDVFDRLNITEIVLADRDRYIQETYLVRDLLDIREALGLKAGEQLCLRGEDQPITVVSEDGVRRQIAAQ